MTAKSKARESRSWKPDIPSDIERRIRQRAYELYEQRSRVNGFALDDWLRGKSDSKAKPSRRRES